MIYGVATLAACMLAGKFIGNLLGLLTGTDADVGGVGFAMILLLIITNAKELPFVNSKDFSLGISFWNKMYIPVVIAMTASQNAYRALSGGILAIIAGTSAVGVSFILLPIINKAITQGINKGGTQR